MIAALDLQNALFDLLSNDAALAVLLGGPKIYDTPPKQAAFPYVSFGPLSAVDWSTSDDFGSAYIVTLNCWSGTAGRKQVLRIADRVTAALNGASAQALEFGQSANAKIILVQPVGMSVENDAATKAIRATLRTRILVEPI
ncbi:MAG: DUF3168 domain-containing protein [Ahrensia sp.]|nr:DUF3168 domain-containing protein [Ahrensia sp.]